MVASGIIPGNGLARRINIFCLVMAVIAVLVLPLKKEIWYDETVSILCSKGISHDTPAQFAGDTSVSSAQINSLNTSANVFRATVIDNANSFLYNYKLHCFTIMFGNSVDTYMLLSKLCAIITLIAFFFLCGQLFNGSLFTGLSVVLLACDMNFISMSHEIRAYAMGAMFVVLAAVFFFRYLWRQQRPLYLFLVSFFSVCALLCHFLAVYIIVVFLAALIVVKGKSLFSWPNVLAVLIPVIPLALFVFFALPGLRVMNTQSKAIEEGYANYGFHLSEVFLRTMKYTAMNFKVIFPAIRANAMVTICSFLFVIFFYGAGIRAAGDKRERTTVHLLFITGISSSVLLMLLSIRAHHYASLYFRYHSFAIPFSTLFIGYVLYLVYKSAAVRPLLRKSLPFLFLLPCLAFFTVGILAVPLKPTPYGAFVYRAADIISNKRSSVTVSGWEEAFLIQSVLPQGYKIDYFRAR